MYRLWRRYRGRVGMQGFWALNLCRRQWEIEHELFNLIRKQEGRYPGAGHQLFQTYQAWRTDGRFTYRIHTIPSDNTSNLEEK
jgi:hypothetical protein